MIWFEKKSLSRKGMAVTLDVKSEFVESSMCKSCYGPNSNAVQTIFSRSRVGAGAKCKTILAKDNKAEREERWIRGS